MKKEILVAAALVGCLLTCSFFFFQSRAEGTEPGDKANNFKVIEGYYNWDAQYFLFHRTFYRITNTSLNNSIVLGDIHVLDQDGINGSTYTYNGYNNDSIPPLGSRWFSLQSTGVPPSQGAGTQSPYTVVVAFTGNRGDMKLTGKVNCYWASSTSPNGYFNVESN